MDAAHIGIVQVRILEYHVRQNRELKVGSGQASAFAVGIGEIDPAQPATGEIGRSKASALYLSPDHIGLAQIGAGKVCALQFCPVHADAPVASYLQSFARRDQSIPNRPALPDCWLEVT